MVLRVDRARALHRARHCLDVYQSRCGSLGASLCRSAVLLARKLFIFVTGEFLFSEQTVNDRDKEERRDRSDEQPANHGAPKRRVLFAALAQSK